jgi:hypothetical protein
MISATDKKSFNPFPGLRPFTPEESELFFGRKGESEEVLGKLLKNRFVTVMGASGTGKSSLIFCGVLPGIKKMKKHPEEKWRIVSFRPGSDPFGNLAKALSLENDGFTRDITGIIRNAIDTSREKVLMVIDQFEELFRYGSLSEKDTTIAQRFIESLVSTVNQDSVNIFTIITMRSDFIGECALYQGLTQLINNSNYLVPHMGRENYREAIVGPVKYAGAEIDPALVDLLLEDIGERTDQLPVLQHAMMRTWTYWQELDEPGRLISKSDYDSVGTMANAMSMHANEAFEELSPRGKEICEKLFKTITDKGSDNKGLRRPTAVGTIISIAGCTENELFEVIEKFRIPSRSFITPRYNIKLTSDSIIDLSHESLMRLWDRLREWVEDEASSVQMYLRLSEASAMYQQGRTSLWRPPDLQLAINWRDTHRPTLAWAQRYDPAFERAMVYLRTSEQEYLSEEENKIRLQKRQIKRTKIVAGILGTAAIISAGFMLFAFVQKIAADKQTRIAVEARKQEELQRHIADSNAVERERQRKLADSAAVVAVNNAAEAERQRRIALTEQQRAVTNEGRALEQEKIAKAQTDSAQKARIRADTNAAIATKQRNTAQQLRMLSIGKAMAIKSLQASGQPDLQALLAYQAYLFNKNNRGLDNDADIYAGLYNIARQSGSSGYKSFTGHRGEVKSIAFIPGKNEFITSGSDGMVYRWSAGNGEDTFRLLYSGKNEKDGSVELVDVLAVSPDAKWLACGISNTGIKMIPLDQDEQSYILSGHKGRIKSLIFSYDGKSLYSAALDGRVLKWDLAARTSKDMTDGSLKITTIDVSSNGNHIAGISADGKVLLWDPEKFSDAFRIEPSGRNIKSIRFNPENNMIAIGDAAGMVEIWDISSRKKISEVKAHDAQVNDIRFNPVLKQMATAGNDSRVRIFNFRNPTDLTEPPITFTDNGGFVMVMQFSSDGQLLVSGAYEEPGNLISRSSHADYFTRDICSQLKRNMTTEEWEVYVARDIPPEKTCQDILNIKVSAIK